MRRQVLPALAVVVAASVPACGRGAGAGGDVEAFVRLFDGYSAEYVPVGTPAELAGMSRLVVSGSITAIHPGPAYPQYEKDPNGLRTVVMAVAVDEVLHGSLPDPGHRSVYVQLLPPGGVAAEVFDRHAPKSATVVLYLVPSREGGPLVTDAEAGRPAGQPLLEPTTPQGFLVEAPGGVVEPTGHRSFIRVGIERFLPSAGPFPSPAPPREHTD